MFTLIQSSSRADNIQLSSILLSCTIIRLLVLYQNTLELIAVEWTLTHSLHNFGEPIFKREKDLKTDSMFQIEPSLHYD